MNETNNDDTSSYLQSSSLSYTFELINRISQKFRDLHRRVIKKFRLTIPQYCVLRQLGMLGGLQLKDLASKCHLSRPTMTGVIDTMEDKKIVMRVKNPEDRRSLLVILTEKGKSLYNSIPMQEKIFKNCCSELNSEEITQLNELLKRFLVNF